LGKAYKPDVDYEDGSYSLLIGHYLETMQAKYYYIDPLTGDEPPFTDMPVIAFLAHNRTITYGYTGEQPEQELYVDLEPGSVVVDPWRQYTTQKDYRVIHYGNTRIV
jgi:hypothetical protein